MSYIEEAVLGIIAFNAFVLIVLYSLSKKQEPRFETSQTSKQSVSSEKPDSAERPDQAEKEKPKINWDMSDGDFGI